MKPLLMRVAGIALIIAAVAGLIFSVVGLIVLTSVEGQVNAAVTEQLELVDRALLATADGLAVAETSLAQAVETVGALEQTMAGVGQMVNGTVPMIDAVAALLGEQLPTTIQTTQETLTSVATSAQVVDDILTVITAIPLLGTDRYSPEVSLQQGFEQVARSLDGIPQSLEAAYQGLTDTRSNLAGVEQNFNTMAADIGQIAASLEGAQSVLVQYQGIVGDLQDLLSSVRQSLPDWLRTLRWALSLVLIWLGVAQIGLLTQGSELIGRSRASRSVVSETGGNS